jgi:hypothetical protein
MGLRPAWIETSLHIHAVWSGSMLFAISFSTCNRVGKRTAWILIRRRGCAGWSGSMLVANPLCWFCCDTTHFNIKIQKLSCHRYRAWSDCTDIEAGLRLYTGGKDWSLLVPAGQGLRYI